MFAFRPQPMLFAYTPMQSSSLAACDPSCCSRTEPFAQSTCTPAIARRREGKYASLLRRNDNERERRRDIFLRKVKQSGDDRRFEARGEQILRLEWLERRKEWETEQGRRAQEILAQPEDEEMECGHETGKPQVDLLDELEHQEDQELQATLSLLDERHSDVQEEYDAIDYGSDDEEYDRLLLDAARRLEDGGGDEQKPSEHQSFDTDTVMG